MDAGKFRFRIIAVLIFFALWAFAIAARLFHFTCAERDHLRSESARIAWREGFIPVVRGKILDSNGVPLAWTELHHDFCLKYRPKRERERNMMLKELNKLGIRPDLDHVQYPLELIRSVSPDRFEILSGLCKTYPALDLVMRLERRRIEYAEIREQIGSCMIDEKGLLNGVDGLEQRFNQQLSGQPGTFAVMLDKTGDWMLETLRVIREPQQPENIYLTQPLDSLRQTKTEAVP